jgi:hypothetical protein
MLNLAKLLWLAAYGDPSRRVVLEAREVLEGLYEKYEQYRELIDEARRIWNGGS